MKKKTLLGIGLLLLAFGIRLALAFYWEDRFTRPIGERAALEEKADSDGPFFFGDSDSYWKLGRALAFHRPYEFDSQRHWTVFRMPGYPALLAPLFLIYGENPPVFAARILNVCFGTITVGLVGLLAFCLFHKFSIAFLSALLVTFDPCSAVQSILILAEEPFVVVMLLQMIVFVLLLRRELEISVSDVENDLHEDAGKWYKNSFSLAFFFGLFSAAAVYFRPSWYYFPLFLFVFLFLVRVLRQELFSRGSIRLALFFLTALVAFSLSLSPWWYRNGRVTGEFVPTTLQLGASLYDGLSPIADGSSNMEFVDRFRQLEQEHPSADPEKTHFEARLDRRMKNAALDWAHSHPEKALELGIVKFKRLWNLVPNEPAFSAPKVKWALFLTTTPLLFLGLLGFLFSIKNGVVYAILWLPAIYITLLHLTFVSSLRYRTPAMYGFMIATAFIVVKIAESRRRGT